VNAACILTRSLERKWWLKVDAEKERINRDAWRTGKKAEREKERKMREIEAR